MTFSQRLIPWLYSKKIAFSDNSLRLFNLVGTSAFATLMVENMSSLGLIEIVALVAALVVSLKSKNLGLTVLSAVIIGIVALFL